MQTPEIIAFIQGLLEKMGIANARVEAGESAGHTVFSITTEDSAALIGHGGETLRALNHIVKRAFEGKDASEEPHFLIDVNGYHALQNKKIADEARQLAERARIFKHDVDMRPLNPYERMLVHEALKDMSELYTESAGEGPMRHVVIRYGAKPSEPGSAQVSG
jgi:spoIIIJ-associated protein